MKPLSRRVTVLAAAAALIATPSFAAQVNADTCIEPAASGSANLEQRSAVIWKCSGADPVAGRVETVPGAPDMSVFILHQRSELADPDAAGLRPSGPLFLRRRMP